MKGVADYVVAYDISSDRERAKVDKVLRGFGFRAQKSVFECRLDKKGKKELIEQLRKLSIKTGFIRLYRIEYSSGSKTVGKINGDSIDNDNAFIV